MARHYTALLQSMVNLPHRTLKSLPGAPSGPKCRRRERQFQATHRVFCTAVDQTLPHTGVRTFVDTIFVRFVDFFWLTETGLWFGFPR